MFLSVPSVLNPRECGQGVVKASTFKLVKHCFFICCGLMDLINECSISFQSYVFWVLNHSGGSCKGWGARVESKPFNSQRKAGSCEFPPDCKSLWYVWILGKSVFQTALPILTKIFSHSLDV